MSLLSKGHLAGRCRSCQLSPWFFACPHLYALRRVAGWADPSTCEQGWPTRATALSTSRWLKLSPPNSPRHGDKPENKPSKLRSLTIFITRHCTSIWNMRVLWSHSTYDFPRNIYDFSSAFRSVRRLKCGHPTTGNINWTDCYYLWKWKSG